MKTKAVFFGLILLLITCGRPYITPHPEYSWPEMASSKIADSLGIYIPSENLSLIYKPRTAKSCCDHKDIKLGTGISKALISSSRAVFAETIMLDDKPSDTYIKSLNLRGLLHLKDISASLEFVPFIEDHSHADKLEQYEVIITLSLNFSAIDFLLSDIREFNIDVTMEGEISVTQGRANRLLEKLCNSALERVADELARKLVTIYGARI